MINTTYGKKILNAFFNTEYQAELKKVQDYPTNTSYAEALAENKVSFPNITQLALFTTMPNADGTGYAEPTSPYYNRVSLVEKGPKAVQIMGAADTETGSGEYAGKNVAVIKNQDIIVFPEVEEVGYNAPVIGFGVFGDGTLLLWGDLTEAVTIEAGEIPVFRIDEFVFKLA